MPWCRVKKIRLSLRLPRSHHQECRRTDPLCSRLVYGIALRPDRSRGASPASDLQHLQNGPIRPWTSAQILRLRHSPGTDGEMLRDHFAAMLRCLLRSLELASFARVQDAWSVHDVEPSESSLCQSSRFDFTPAHPFPHVEPVGDRFLYQWNMGDQTNRAICANMGVQDIQHLVECT